jgi:hypothetical protein
VTLEAGAGLSKNGERKDPQVAACVELFDPGLPFQKLPKVASFRAKHALGLDPGVEAGSHRNQVYADCVDLSAVENASKTKF